MLETRIRYSDVQPLASTLPRADNTMPYAPTARPIVIAIQEARDDGDIWFSYVLYRLYYLAEPESALVRALHDERVWQSGFRDQFLRAMRELPGHAQPTRFRDANIRLDQFFEKHDAYARRDRAAEVSELHITKALVELCGGVFPDYGLSGAKLVHRVEQLERHDEPLCFVLMPFAEELRIVYTSAIRPAAESACLRCERADDVARPGVVLDHIDEAIRGARIIVADLTGLNPNVMHEFGFARCCGKPTVLITQQPLRELPFDLRPFRAYQYEASEGGLESLRGWLQRSFDEVLGEQPVPATDHEAPIGELQLRFDYVRSVIEPRLAAEGYEMMFPNHAGADQYKLAGWEDVVWPDAQGRLCRVRTEDHTPLRRRASLQE
jgi:hypothetical protein